MNDRVHDVIAVGGSVVGAHTLDCPLISATFDDDDLVWTLATDDGRRRARMLLDCGSPLVPWIPRLPGVADFRGQVLHATTIPADFDPSTRRIAVIGADSAAGRSIATLIGSGAAVTVFPLPPRRVIRAGRRFRRRPFRGPDVVSTSIEAVTSSGIRTTDGLRREVDTIVFGTGFSISTVHPAVVGPCGRALAQAWRDGEEPYLGVAAHGFPNYFMVGGADPDAQQRYVAECLRLTAGHARIEVRRSSQQVFNERAHLRPPSQRPDLSAFDLSSADVHGDVYDGIATLTLAEHSRQVRLRLTGCLNPIDGQYHWQGTLFDQLPDDVLRSSRAVHVTAGGHTVAARITEATNQGNHSIAGVGAPPFALKALEAPRP